MRRYIKKYYIKVEPGDYLDSNNLHGPDKAELVGTLLCARLVLRKANAFDNVSEAWCRKYDDEYMGWMMGSEEVWKRVKKKLIKLEYLHINEETGEWGDRNWDKHQPDGVNTYRQNGRVGKEQYTPDNPYLREKK